MRVTLNLKCFFHDHRSFAKVLISESMTYIQDLENHISKIFGVNSFYLKCDNHYLPPLESVRILDNDDIVWAIPLAEDGLPEEIPQISSIKKKRKKKHTFDKTDQNDESNRTQEVINVEEVPVIKKKSKKRKNELTILNDTFPNHEDITNCEVKIKKKRLEKNTSVGEQSMKPIQKDSGRDSLGSTKSSDSESEKKSCQPHSNIIGRKINIVKTIVISNNKKSSDTEDVKTIEKDQPKQTVNVITEETWNTPIEMSIEKSETQKHNVNDIETSSNFSFGTSTMNESDFVTNVIKKKRKRVRKRKPMVNNRREVSTSLEHSIHNHNHEQTIFINKSSHIRFGDEELSGDVTKEPAVNRNDGNHDSNLDNKMKVRETIEDEVILINDSIIMNEDKEDEVTRYLGVKEFPYNAKQIEQCILKQPITRNSEPRVADVIAFKILRISESYTPEVSSTIVGKVINYKPETKDIVFSIMYGHDQCVLPEGKFSVNQDNQSPKTNCQFECSWSSLLEPRLIFP